MRDCKNCKHLIMFDYKNKSYSCESRECEFDPEEQEPTTKNDKVDCEHTDCNNCVNHKYCDYEPTTKNDLEHHKQNIKAYAHDFGVSEEQAEKELAVKNDLGVDCISRQAVIDLMMQKWGENFSGDDAMQESIDAIRVMPSVTLQEPKTGHWIETHDDWGNGIITDRKYKCSVCHGKHIDPEMGEWHEVFDYKYPFCPNCGVKMAESEDT